MRATVLAVVVALGAVLAGCSSSSASGTSALVVSDTSQGWTFHNGQTIRVAMGPNKTFKPFLRINILECADPGGTKAHLPTSINTCDENTIQANSLIPSADGSFTQKAYTVYSLPNATLGEGPTWQPVCNATHECVLYVGEDQDDFTKPKIFSQPFTVTGGTT
jgi:hypothetical protein